MTSTEFAQEVKNLTGKLELARASIAHKKQNLHESCDRLKGQRTEALQAHAERMLPDFEQKTLAALQARVPKFVTNEVRAIFVDAETMHIPWTTAWFGDPEAYRVRALAADMNMLRTRLAATIEITEGMFSELEDLRQIDKKITAANETLRTLDSQDTEIEERISSLNKIGTHVAKNPTLPVPRQFAQSVRQSTQSFESTSSAQEDSMDDFLIYWATGLPTSFRTLVVSALFSDNDTPHKNAAHEESNHELPPTLEMMKAESEDENADTEDNGGADSTDDDDPSDEEVEAEKDDDDSCETEEDEALENDGDETEDIGDLS